MLLLFGIGEGQDDLDLGQKITCPVCGKKAKLEGFRTYRALRLFFVPVLRWDLRYYVRTTCCGTVRKIGKRQGEEIYWGERDRLDVAALGLKPRIGLRVCRHCGFDTTAPSYRFCPLCGKPFEKEPLCLE